MQKERKIGFETPEERMQRLLSEQIGALQKTLEGTIEERLGPLREQLSSLEERLVQLEVRMEHLEQLGYSKRTQCKHNIGGICRQWASQEEPVVVGMKFTKLGETGKFHPEPTDGFCASCTFFGGPTRRKQS